MSKGINNIRDNIDQVDQQLIGLLAKRRQLSKQASATKSSKKAKVRDLNREQTIMDNLYQIGQKQGLENHYINEIYQRIIKDSVQIQYTNGLLNANKLQTHALQLAHLGDSTAYSYAAAQQHAAGYQNLRLKGYPTMRSVLHSVESGDTDLAILPIENTTSGSINQVYDLLQSSQVSIVAEEQLAVHHCLVAKANTQLETVSTVYAHPQAYSQCQQNLSKLGINQTVACESTSEALNNLLKTEREDIAVIASADAAMQLGLDILMSKIADQQHNTSRFVVLSNSPWTVPQNIAAKTSIMLHCQQKPGALAELLLILREHNLNLIKLESRPIAEQPWQEMFYIDIEGNTQVREVQQALNELTRIVPYIKILGCYPNSRIQPTKQTTDVRAKVSTQQQHQACQSTTSATTTKNNKQAPYYSREHKQADTHISVGNCSIGSASFVVIAGPCAVESQAQVEICAKLAKQYGAHILRGGCFKPRTSPYSFQGLGLAGLELLANSAAAQQLPIITELMHTDDLQAVAQRADIIQIGARNMQNFALLKAVGKVDRPVMLKRGLMASIDELLNAAEYILAQGNQQVILCERGIRTFETATRNTLDLSAVPLLKKRSHLPIIVDPSHAVGQRDLVIPMALAAKAAGAHGIMIEFHPEPEKALSDGPQALYPEQFEQLMTKLSAI